MTHNSIPRSLYVEASLGDVTEPKIGFCKVFIGNALKGFLRKFSSDNKFSLDFFGFILFLFS